MKSEQFIKDHGVKKAREVVEGAPEYATHFELTIDGVFYFKYFEFSWFCFGEEGLINTYMDDHESCHLIDLRILKRLVGSVDRVNQRGGYLAAKELLSFSIVHQEAFGKDAVSDELINSLKGEIADYESIYGEEGASHE